MPISTKKPDDKVGQGREFDDGRQTPEQKAVLGGGGEEGGRPEPKSTADWGDRGASGGVPGRPPVAIGGNSQGQGDRMPTGGGTVSNEAASNPKTRPGNEHEA
jgi:hypothetical protein